MVQATRVTATSRNFPAWDAREARTRHRHPTGAARRPRSIEPSSVAARAAAPCATGSIAILGFVDPKCAAFEVLAIERLHRAGCIRIRHFHKTETARSPRVTIG